MLLVSAKPHSALLSFLAGPIDCFSYGADEQCGSVCLGRAPRVVEAYQYVRFNSEYFQEKRGATCFRSS
jgi:hypothetical protein